MQVLKMILLILLIISKSYAQSSIDQKLSQFIQKFHARPLPTPQMESRELFFLGRSLFFEKKLSGHKNISCADCHHPSQFTTEPLPVTVGEGAKGIGERRIQSQGRLGSRNSPALYNLGHADQFKMFWDGRVQFAQFSKSYQTPSDVLNGHKPKRADITSVLDGALSAQALFPLLNHTEMRGLPGSNELANAISDEQVWELIMQRLMKDSNYQEMFQKAYPQTTVFNIGHVGKAIAAFIRSAFAFNNTPFDQYMQGDLNALTLTQKKGAIVFFEQGKCAKCHSGPHLSTFDFKTLAIPQIGPGEHDGDDLGRFPIELIPWVKEKYPYSFRVPALRNVALTAPYMHNGAFESLERVLEHYTNPVQSLLTYQSPRFSFYRNFLGVERSQNNNRLAHLDRELQDPPKLTEKEKSELIEFVRFGLTDVRLQRFIPK